MRIFYTSSDGQKFDFSTLKDAPSPRIARIKSADFHRWEYYADGISQQYGMMVSQYNRDPVEYEVQLYLYGSVEERETFLERFHNAIMRDITLNTPGRLTWGDWQIDCVVIASDTYPHETLPFTTVNDLRIYCPNPRWMLPETINIVKGVSPVGINTGFEYAFDWPIDYAAPMKPNEYIFSVNHHIPSDFKLYIYGPVSRPKLTIADHVYEIETAIPQGLYVEVDSRNKTVMRSDGKNLFNYRNFESSIFEKIPSGKITVKRSADFMARLTIYKESDEPRWTLLSQM